MNFSPLVIQSHLADARKRPSGFSLVEVVMALGIFSFAIIPLLGLMGLGLNVSKESVDASAMAQIFRLTEAQFMTNGALTSGTSYFSNYGDEVPAATSGDTVYEAVVSEITQSDDAKGLLARRVLEVKVRRANGLGDILGKRVLELSRDPVDMQSYFK